MLIETEDWGGVPPSISRNLGGLGYSAIVDPADDCPECDGIGHLVTHIRDTRELSEATLVLFDGVKDTHHGVEIKFQDRAKALENVARHLGMFDGKDEANPFTDLAAAIMETAQAVPVATRNNEDEAFKPSHAQEVDVAADARCNYADDLDDFDDGVSNVEVEP